MKLDKTAPDYLLQKEILKVQSKIAKRRIRLDKAIEKLNNELDALKAQCTHIGHSKIPNSNTGNYDPSLDCYWYECECNICGKRWHIPQ